MFRRLIVLAGALFCLSSMASAAPSFSKLVVAGKDFAIRAMVRSANGGYLLLGRAEFPKTQHDACVVKLDEAGVCVWSTAVGTPVDDEPECIIESSTGDVVGSFLTGKGDGSLVAVEVLPGSASVFCLSPEGKLRWCSPSGGRSTGVHPIVAETRSGYLVLDRTENDQIAVTPIDREGNVGGPISIVPTQKELAPDLTIQGLARTMVRATEDGGVLIASCLSTQRQISKTIESHYLPCLVKLDSSYAVQWCRAFYPSNVRENVSSPISIFETEDGYLASYGATISTIFLKVDKSGSLLWANNSKAGLADAATTLADGQTLYVTSEYDAVLVDREGKVRKLGNISSALGASSPRPGTLALAASAESQVALAWLAGPLTPWSGSGDSPANTPPVFEKLAPFEGVASGAGTGTSAKVIAEALAYTTLEPRMESTKEPQFGYWERTDAPVSVEAQASGKAMGFLNAYRILDKDGTYNVAFHGAVSTHDGAFLALGEEPFQHGTFLLKLDSGGKVLGKLPLGRSSYALGLARTDHGTVLVLANLSTGHGSGTIYLAEADDDLRLVWTSLVGEGVNGISASIASLGKSGYAVFASIQPSAAAVRTLLAVGLDAAGRQRWVRAIGGISKKSEGVFPYQWPIVAVSTKDGAVLIWNEHPGAESPSFVQLMKLDAEGKPLLQRRLDTDAGVEALGASVEADGTVRIMVRTHVRVGDETEELGQVVLDSAGRLVGQMFFSDSRAQNIWRVEPVAEGGFLVSWDVWDREEADRRHRVGSELRSLDAIGNERWSLALPSLIEIAPFGAAASADTLAAAIQTGPLTGGKPPRLPRLMQLNGATAQKKNLEALERGALAPLRIEPSKIPVAALPLTPLTAHPTGIFYTYDPRRPDTEREYAIANDSRVRVRGASDLNGETLGFLTAGDKVEVISHSAQKMKIESMEDYWYLIKRVSDNLVGWTYGRFLSLK